MKNEKTFLIKFTNVVISLPKWKVHKSGTHGLKANKSGPSKNKQFSLFCWGNAEILKVT